MIALEPLEYAATKSHMHGSQDRPMRDSSSLELLDRPIVLQIEEARLGSMGVLFQDDEFIQYNFLEVIVHPCWGVAIFHSFFTTHP